MPCWANTLNVSLPVPHISTLRDDIHICTFHTALPVMTVQCKQKRDSFDRSAACKILTNHPHITSLRGRILTYTELYETRCWSCPIVSEDGVGADLIFGFLSMER